MHHKLSCLAIGLALCGTASAKADDLFSFTYSDLSGNFSDTPGRSGNSIGVFWAADDGDTDGEVTRLVSPLGDAFFEGDGVDLPGFASFLLSTSLASTNATTATLDGLGLLEIRDVDDDLISADVSGEWTKVGNAAHFNGLITNVLIDSDDGTFDGTDGSSISLIFDADQPFSGNIINLTSGGWFTSATGVPESFTDRTTLTSGVVVPEPATIGLLALGGIASLIRRRK